MRQATDVWGGSQIAKLLCTYKPSLMNQRFNEVRFTDLIDASITCANLMHEPDSVHCHCTSVLPMPILQQSVFYLLDWVTHGWPLTVVSLSCIQFGSSWIRIWAQLWIATSFACAALGWHSSDMSSTYLLRQTNWISCLQSLRKVLTLYIWQCRSSMGKLKRLGIRCKTLRLCRSCLSVPSLCLAFGPFDVVEAPILALLRERREIRTKMSYTTRPVPTLDRVWACKYDDYTTRWQPRDKLLSPMQSESINW